MRARAAAVAVVSVVLTGLVLTGCGGGSSEDGRATERLKAQVAAVEYAVAGGDYDAARQGLNRIRATTIRLTDRGHIDSLRATEILDAVEDTDLVLIRLGGRDPDEVSSP